MRPPLKKIEFCRGQSIQVSINEDGFLGSYYEVRVVPCLQNGFYTFHYKNLLEDDKSQPLTEIIYPKELCPLSPTISVPGFLINQKVDASDNDGWWVGVITDIDVLENYFLYFATIHMQIAPPFSWLRVHQDWINDKWVLSKESLI